MPMTASQVEGVRQRARITSDGAPWVGGATLTELVTFNTEAGLRARLADTFRGKPEAQQVATGDMTTLRRLSRRPEVRRLRMRRHHPPWVVGGWKAPVEISEWTTSTPEWWALSGAAHRVHAAVKKACPHDLAPITISYAQIAALAGLDRRTVIYAVKELRAAGFLVSQRQIDAAGDPCASRYKFVPPPSARVGNDDERIAALAEEWSTATQLRPEVDWLHRWESTPVQSPKPPPRARDAAPRQAAPSPAPTEAAPTSTSSAEAAPASSSTPAPGTRKAFELPEDATIGSLSRAELGALSTWLVQQWHVLIGHVDEKGELNATISGGEVGLMRNALTGTKGNTAKGTAPLPGVGTVGRARLVVTWWAHRTLRAIAEGFPVRLLTGAHTFLLSAHKSAEGGALPVFRETPTWVDAYENAGEMDLLSRAHSADPVIAEAARAQLVACGFDPDTGRPVDFEGEPFTFSSAAAPEAAPAPSEALDGPDDPAEVAALGEELRGLLTALRALAPVPGNKWSAAALTRRTFDGEIARYEAATARHQTGEWLNVGGPGVGIRLNLAGIRARVEELTAWLHNERGREPS